MHSGPDRCDQQCYASARRSEGRQRPVVAEHCSRFQWKALSSFGQADQDTKVHEELNIQCLSLRKKVLTHI